ncbi:MAG: hypothetical protein QF681_12210 [Vicinamibacterales bacterium]|jgi:hypothetical protein|nr:hypothetical protein [Vicinamibacterales bacterium]
MEYLVWLEETAFSTWMRESGPAFFSNLIFHSVAMGFVVGVHVATNLRLLGVAPRIPLSLMRRFFPVVWVNLFVVSLSGVLLLVAYPAKALTNPVFYLKLGAVLAALCITRSLIHGVMRDPAHDAGCAPTKARALAALSLVLWIGAITSGRFLAYTHQMMMASHQN